MVASITGLTAAGQGGCGHDLSIHRPTRVDSKRPCKAADNMSWTLESRASFYHNSSIICSGIGQRWVLLDCGRFFGQLPRCAL